MSFSGEFQDSALQDDVRSPRARLRVYFIAEHHGEWCRYIPERRSQTLLQLVDRLFKRVAPVVEHDSHIQPSYVMPWIKTSGGDPSRVLV